MQHVEALEILLQGICGVHRDRLRVHEICLKNNPNLGKYLNFLKDNLFAKYVYNATTHNNRMKLKFAPSVDILRGLLALSLLLDAIFSSNYYDFYKVKRSLCGSIYL